MIKSVIETARLCYNSSLPTVQQMESGMNVIHYLSRDATNKTLDIQLSWARLLTWSIGAFQASRRFTQSGPFAQRCVFNVIKVFQQVWWTTRLKKEK